MRKKMARDPGRATKATAIPFRLFILLFAIHFPPAFRPLLAYEDRSRYSVGIEGGLSLPAAPSDFTGRYNRSNTVGARVKEDLTEEWSVAAVFASQRYHQKSNSSQTLTTQPITLMGFYSLTRTVVWNPYLAFALGFSRNNRKVFAVEQEWTRLTAAVGAGAEMNISVLNSLGAEVLYRYFTKASAGEKDFQVITLSFVMHFYIPDSWIPDKPRKPIVPAAQPEPSPTPVEDTSVKVQAQEELNKVQQDIFDKKIPPIQFETGQSVILPSSNETLDVVGTILRRYPQFSIRVEGHTDNVGDDTANLALSNLRAEAVRQYLIKNFNLPQEKITGLGFGESQPIADNDTEEGRFKNRRVEFKIIQ